MPDSLDFEEALKNPSARQGFLEAFISSETSGSSCIPGCSGIWYDPDFKLVRDFVYHLSIKLGMNEGQARRQVEFISGAKEHEPYAFVPSAPMLAGLFTDMPIFVWTEAFSGKISQEELRHCLIAHEGTHIRQRTTGYPYFDTAMYREAFKLGQIRPIIRQLIDELDAHHHGRIQAGNFKLGVSYTRRIQRQTTLLITGLYNGYIDSASDLERGCIKGILDEVPHQPKLIQTGEIRRFIR